MRKNFVRLGLIGSENPIAAKPEMLQRLREARVTTTAESMKEALLRGHSETYDFDAAIVGCFEDALSAAQCGKHVYLDAPITQSLQEVESLTEVCRKVGVFLALGRLPRYTPACQIIVERLRAGKLGLPGLLRVHRWWALSAQPVWSTVYGDIDLALQLYQARPTEIYAVGRSDHAYVQVHLGFPDGGMGLLDFAHGMPAGPPYNSLSLIGSKGAAYADDHHNTHLLFTGENVTVLFSDSEEAGLAGLREFVNGIAGGGSPSTLGEPILMAQRVTDAIRRSLESSEALQLRGGEYEPA